MPDSMMIQRTDTQSQGMTPAISSPAVARASKSKAARKTGAGTAGLPVVNKVGQRTQKQDGAQHAFLKKL